MIQPAPEGPSENPITADGPLVPVILRLAAPVVLMMYLQNAYNIIDTVWVGQLLGKVSLAGIAVGGYVLWAVFGLVQLVSVGLAAIVARRVGEKDVEQAERMATRGMRYALLMSVVVGAVTWLGLPPLFDLMGAEGLVREEGLAYMRVLLLGSPFIFLSFTIGAVYRAAGDTVTPMWLMAVSLVFNLILDPVLMLGLGGLPAMGIAGAALATVIARAVWVFVGWALLRRGLRIGIRFGLGGPVLLRPLPRIAPGPLVLGPLFGRGFDWSGFLAVIRIGLAPALSMVLFPVVYMILVRIPAEFGPHQVAALRIGHTVEGMCFFLALGVSLATSTLVGQNLGAGKPARAARAAWISAGLTSLVLAGFSVAFFFLAAPISSLFNPEPDTIAAGAVYLQIVACSQIFMGLEIVLGGGFNGAGATLPPMAVAVPFNLVRIPLAFYLASRLGWGVDGVWWTISGTAILKGVLLTGWFGLGRWSRKTV